MQRSTTRRLLPAGLAALALLAAWMVGQSRPAADESRDRRIEALADRVAALERVVGTRTTSVAQDSLAERLKTLEGAVRDLVRATGGTPGVTVGSDLRELERTVRASERQADDLARRVAALERTASRAADPSSDLRALRADLTGLRRKVDELESRVRRLER